MGRPHIRLHEDSREGAVKKAFEVCHTTCPLSQDLQFRVGLREASLAPALLGRTRRESRERYLKPYADTARLCVE